MPFSVPHRIRNARAQEAGELFTLQRAAYVGEAQRQRNPNLPQLTETLEEVSEVVASPYYNVLVAITTEEGEWGHRSRIIGAVRLRPAGSVLHFSRLIVAPDLSAHGIGSSLLSAVIDEGERTPSITTLELDATGGFSDNLAIYRRFGFNDVTSEPGLRVLTRAV